MNYQGIPQVPQQQGVPKAQYPSTLQQNPQQKGLPQMNYQVTPQVTQQQPQTQY